MRHDARLVLGVCGHWWQVMGRAEDALATNCPAPECGRPPGHILRPVVLHEHNTLFVVESPADCGFHPPTRAGVVLGPLSNPASSFRFEPAKPKV